MVSLASSMLKLFNQYIILDINSLLGAELKFLEAHTLTLAKVLDLTGIALNSGCVLYTAEAGNHR